MNKKNLYKILIAMLLTVTICTQFLNTSILFEETSEYPALSITPENANGKKF